MTDKQKDIEKKDKEKVSVERDALEAILKRLDDQDAIIKRQEESIRVVTEAADKGRLERILGKEKKEVGMVVKLSTLTIDDKDKIVVCWRMKKNRVWKDPITMAWKEDQVIEFIFDDDSSKEMDYLTAMTSVVKIEASVTSKTIDNNGGTTLKVVTKDGKELMIDAKYVN